MSTILIHSLFFKHCLLIIKIITIIEVKAAINIIKPTIEPIIAPTINIKSNNIQTIVIVAYLASYLPVMVLLMFDYIKLL